LSRFAAIATSRTCTHFPKDPITGALTALRCPPSCRVIRPQLDFEYESLAAHNASGPSDMQEGKLEEAFRLHPGRCSYYW
jgi:hypothetical protein